MNKLSNMNINLSGGDEQEDFNFIKVNKSHNIDSKALMNKFNKVISHDNFQNATGYNRYDKVMSKGKARKLLDVNSSSNVIGEGSSVVYQSAK